MPSFAAQLGPSWGTDPEGDAERRAEQGVVELGDGTTVAGVPEHALPEVADRLAVLGGYGLPAARAQAAEREAHSIAAADDLVRDLAVELGVEPKPDDPEGHTPEHGEHGGVGWVRCSCGTWEALVTGPSSAAWARRDYSRHLAEVAVAGDA